MLNLDLEISVVQASDLTTEEFYKNYFEKQKPVLIKGLVFEQAAGKKWTIEWFKENFGHIDVDVFDNSNEEHKYGTSVMGNRKLNFSKFLDIINSPQPSEVRMFRYNLYKHFPELKQDFSCPRLFNSGPFKNMGYMFLGGTDSEVRMHYDVDNANVLLSQITGRKRIQLFAPDQSKYLYQIPFTTQTLVDMKNPDLDKFPLLQKANGYEFIQEPGDSLFMPCGWWHFNTYLEGGISVAYRKLAPSPLQILEAIYFMGVTMPFDKIAQKILGSKWHKKKEEICFNRASLI